MAKRKAAKGPTYNIEALVNGLWLWVILPPFKARADAEADAQRMQDREPGSSYRVVEA